MARIAEKPVVAVTATFTVTEGELRALEALAGYGNDAFMKAFYSQLGETYMKPYDKDMREFLSSIRDIAGPILNRVDQARKVFNK